MRKQKSFEKEDYKKAKLILEEGIEEDEDVVVRNSKNWVEVEWISTQEIRDMKRRQKQAEVELEEVLIRRKKKKMNYWISIKNKRSKEEK